MPARRTALRLAARTVVVAALLTLGSCTSPVPLQSCRTQADCPSGQVCTAGICVDAEAPDAGAASDAGVAIDAGAGIDAGAEGDAGAPDSGPRHCVFDDDHFDNGCAFGP
ncbi:MAG: hypothetical protein HY901_18235 [Deltaproteobacteria bacterium]|nr:hypothetical protein [Deltaproteobacteria bacterium]